MNEDLPAAYQDLKKENSKLREELAENQKYTLYLERTLLIAKKSLTAIAEYPGRQGHIARETLEKIGGK